MGCWNETCMVSHLPITWGDEVAMTVVTKNHDGEWYKPNSMYYISPIMFYGKYNDYGTGEECHGLGIDFAAEEFRKYKTDIESTFDPDQFVERIAREELQFNNVQTFKASLNGMKDVDHSGKLGFIRKDVLDRILDEFSWEQTFYDKDETQQFIYHTINYQYYLDCIPAAIDTFKAYYKECQEEADALNGPSITLMYHPVPDSDMHDSNVLVKWIYAQVEESKLHPFHKSIGEKIKKLAEENRDAELSAFLAEFAKYAVLYKFMTATRKVFTPQPNTSQDSSTDAHRFLAKITTEIGAEMDRERDEENEAWDPVRGISIYQNSLDLE